MDRKTEVKQTNDIGVGEKTAQRPMLPPLALFIQFSDCGQHIRKWSTHHFDGANGYTIYHASNLAELSSPGGDA